MNRDTPWTPGPWSVEAPPDDPEHPNWYVLGADGELVAETHTSALEGWRDAQLIALAPLMAAAILALTEEHERCSEADTGACETWGNELYGYCVNCTRLQEAEEAAWVAVSGVAERLREIGGTNA